MTRVKLSDYDILVEAIQHLNNLKILIIKKMMESPLTCELPSIINNPILLNKVSG